MRKQTVMILGLLAASVLPGIASAAPTAMRSAQAPPAAAPRAPRPLPAPVPTRPAVAQTSWTDLHVALPSSGALLEGSYLGHGQHTGHEYRLHLLQYMERTDAFVAVLESEARDIAVLGFVSAETDGTYAWKQVSASPDREQIIPQATRAPMYRLRPRFGGAGLPAEVELTGLSPDSGMEIVRFASARRALMYRRPIVGDYSNQGAGPATWTLHVRPDPRGGLWHLEQQTSSNGDGTFFQEKDLAKFDLPGVLAVRPAQYRGYEAQPSPQVRWAMVTVIGTTSSFWSGETYFTQALMFELTSVAEAEKAPAEAGEEPEAEVEAAVAIRVHEAHEAPSAPAPALADPVLTRPKQGHRLRFVEPGTR